MILKCDSFSDLQLNLLHTVKVTSFQIKINKKKTLPYFKRYMSSKQWIVAIHHHKYRSCLFPIHFRSHTVTQRQKIYAKIKPRSPKKQVVAHFQYRYIYTPVKKYCLNIDGYLRTYEHKKHRRLPIVTKMLIKHILLKQN